MWYTFAPAPHGFAERGTTALHCCTTELLHCSTSELLYCCINTLLYCYAIARLHYCTTALMKCITTAMLHYCNESLLHSLLHWNAALLCTPPSRAKQCWAGRIVFLNKLMTCTYRVQKTKPLHVFLPQVVCQKQKPKNLGSFLSLLNI